MQLPKKAATTMLRTVPGRTPKIAAILLLAFLCSVSVALAVTLPNGEPDPAFSDLRLWLRADAGVLDSAGHGPADPDFSGLVEQWKDQSARHFDLSALPEKAPLAERMPLYVPREPGAANRPTIAFGGGRLLARPNETLHEHVNSTTFLVLQIQPGRPQSNNVVFNAGDPGGKHESISFEHPAESDPSHGFLRWSTATSNGQNNVDDALHIPADGRFAIVVIRSTGETSSVEVHDGLGDALGAHREVLPDKIAAVSNQCGRGYFLGGVKFDQPQNGYDGQVAEVLVYKRAMSSAERLRIVTYLRRKYDLDVLDALFPAGTLLMQAEDFDGPWPLNARRDQTAAMCLGHRHVTTRGQQTNEGMKRTVSIALPGAYSVWVRAFSFERRNGLRTSVGGKSLPPTHHEGPVSASWQLAGTVDLQAGETEIAFRAEGMGRRDCDAVLISPAITTLAGVEEVCALTQRLRRVQSPGQIAAVFEDGRRIEGSLLSGWRGSGVQIGRDGSSRPALRCLFLDGLTADPNPPSDALLEFHNGDRMRGTICGYAAAATQAGQSLGAAVLVQPSQEFSKPSEKPIAVEIDWLRRIVLDTAGPPRHCPPRSVVCRDGRLIAFRALRFSSDGVTLLTDKGVVRLATRELAEIAMQPLDGWEAYYRQLAEIDPRCEAGIVRLEAGQGMVFTASTTRATAFRAEAEPAASTIQVQPAWSRDPIPLTWTAVRTIWRAPATVVPLSLFSPLQVARSGALGSSWKWQADHSVAGGDLRSGGLRYLWGFGVHAPNELTFRLPDSAQAFRTAIGIDSTMDDAGCIVARIYLNEASGTPLLQSKPILGSQTAFATGDISLARASAAAQRLVLVMDDGGEARGPTADPLDIGDHAGWLEPTLLLDSAKLRAAVEKYRPLKK